MSFESKDIEHIARLAKLQIEQDQQPSLASDLDHILELVKKMDNIDTQQIKPLAHPYETTQPMREDSVTETNQRELLMSNAPKSLAGLFLVPKVIDSE